MTPPPPPPEPPKAEPKNEVPLIGKWSPKIYGFIQMNAIEDTTQSFSTQAGNAVIARPGTYAGEHPRLTMTAQHSRLGFKFGTGEGDVKASATLEVDFLGSFPSGTAESTILAAPIIRMRHAYFKLENPFLDLLMGQTWALLGWQGAFHPAMMEIQGVPGEVYQRTPQIRLSKTIKGDAANFDIAFAAARPPQRDSGIPDLEAGLKLTVNNWKGTRTNGASTTSIDSMGIGVSGAYRFFEVNNFAAKPNNAVSEHGWAFSADTLIPIIPATNNDKGNTLTLTGSFVTGSADADFYSALTGGVTQPTLPNPMMVTPAPTFTADVDNGLVVFNTAGELTPVKWWSTIVGLQYYFPPSGQVFLTANYSHMHSSNIGDLAPPATVFDTSNWFESTLFIDVTTAVRLAFEYEWFEQTYADGVAAHNSRFNVAGLFVF
jgi:hypothetical protein